jgi:adenylate cyclase
MIGPGTLVNLLLGRYHRPVAEDRIFMFLDSTAIAPLRGKVEALRVDG